MKRPAPQLNVRFFKLEVTMAEAVVILTIFDKILNILGLIKTGKIEKDEKIDKSLLSLYAALSETKAYVLSLNDGEDRDRGKEFSLARLWHDASVPLRNIDSDLAKKCFLKGSYWLEPEAWDEARVAKHQIALDQVFEETRELLVGR